ncbi:hypothetical protein ACQPV1_18450 [Clostridium neonatale]|uniref:hypothetical protein n=1 Tax=Clostridium neonatale TaxID=137838 RepID=UPI003D32E20C
MKNKLIYNDVLNRPTEKDLLNMNDYEYLDYLTELDKGVLNDDEIILKSGLGVDEIIEEKRKFNDKLAEIINVNNINIKNKPKFFDSIVKCKGEIKLLIEVFVCDMNYIFSFKRIVRGEKKKENIARYLRLKSRLNRFEQILQFIKNTEENYDEFLKMILKDEEILKGEEITKEQKRTLKNLFFLYVSNKYDDKILDENIEYVHKFCTTTEERKKVYPALMFRILVKYASKLGSKGVMISTGKLLNYKEYIIYEDNGKNYKTNGNYIKLFFELCNNFCNEDNIPINFYMFERYCNLGKWYWLIDNKNKEFEYTYESLVDTNRSIYDLIFDYESDYSDDYSDRGIKTEYEEESEDISTKKKNTKKSCVVSEDDFIDDIINEHIRECIEYDDEYMRCYFKGRRSANKYVEKVAEKILKYVEEEEIKNDTVFIRHMRFNTECALHEISNNVVRIWLIGYFKTLDV